MSSTHYYHTQPKPVSTRARCPVCNQAAYSAAGIHPQCAERQADPPRPKDKSKAPVLIAATAEGDCCRPHRRKPGRRETAPLRSRASTVHREVRRSRKNSRVRSSAFLVGWPSWSTK